MWPVTSTVCRPLSQVDSECRLIESYPRRVAVCHHVGMSFRLFAAALLSGGILWAQTAAPFEVEEATIAQVHEAMRAGRLTCRGLVDAYIRRIDAYDKNGPAINAIVIINPEATKEADELDRRFAQSGLTGPLHCVPMIVKDNFETKGLQTSDGALAFAGYLPKEDATQVARVKAAGAIVLAKSNMAEWAFSPVETVSSILPGYTKNPYALDRVTAGSSGGTAAAIAASFGLVGFGSDTGDSIRGPSSHQSLVGHPVHDGSHQPRRRVSAEPARRCSGTDGPHPGRRRQGVSGDRGGGSKRSGDGRSEGTRHSRLQQVARPERPERSGHRGICTRPTSGTQPIRRLSGSSWRRWRICGERVRRLSIRRRWKDWKVKRPTGAGPCMGFKYDLNHFLADREGQVPLADLAAILKSGKFHPSVAEAAGGCRKRAGEWPGFGSVPGRRRLSRTIPRNGGEDDGPAEAGCLRVSHMEQSTAADWGLEYAGRRQQPGIFADNGFSGNQCADGLFARRHAASGYDILRPGMVGSAVDQAGVCL